jgi:hypothetical protein
MKHIIFLIYNFIKIIKLFKFHNYLYTYKLLKIKFYIVYYPSHGNMKKNVILGHVDFFWNSLDIINKNIFHYLMSKNSKNISFK